MTQLHQTFIAHLTSVTQSPLLIESLGHFEQLYRPDLSAWLAKLTPLDISEQFLPHKFTRIGLYYEALIEFLCTKGYKDGVFPYELITKNLQVNTPQSTVGEFDFLLHDQSGKQIHLEAAIKYFLLNDKLEGESENWSSWVGPNSRDRLDIKMERMRDHQLTLGQRKESEESLLKYSITPSELAVNHLIQGQLFTKLSDETTIGAKEHCPANCNPNAVNGYWLRENELEEMLNTRNWIILPLHRTCWIYSDGNSQLLPKPDLIKTPFLCAVQDKSGLEICRLMVVEDKWPMV